MAGPAPAASIMRRARCIVFSTCSAAMCATPIPTASGAGRVVMPHVVASMDELMARASCVGGAGGAYAVVRRLRWRAGEERAGRKRRGLASSDPRAVLPSSRRPVAVSCISARAAISSNAPGGQRSNGFPFARTPIPRSCWRWRTNLLMTGKHDEEFLRSHCVGFERWRDYLLGAERWHCQDRGLGCRRFPKCRRRGFASLPAELAATRSFINVTWSLQRADHGEQPFWAAVGLAVVARANRLARWRLRRRLRHGQYARKRL